MKIKKTSWEVKLLKFAWGYDATRLKGYCQLFWLTVLTVIVMPLVLLGMAYCKILYGVGLLINIIFNKLLPLHLLATEDDKIRAHEYYLYYNKIIGSDISLRANAWVIHHGDNWINLALEAKQRKEARLKREEEFEREIQKEGNKSIDKIAAGFATFFGWALNFFIAGVIIAAGYFLYKYFSVIPWALIGKYTLYSIGTALVIALGALVLGSLFSLLGRLFTMLGKALPVMEETPAWLDTTLFWVSLPIWIIPFCLFKIIKFCVFIFGMVYKKKCPLIEWEG